MVFRPVAHCNHALHGATRKNFVQKKFSEFRLLSLPLHHADVPLAARSVGGVAIFLESQCFLEFETLFQIVNLLKNVSVNIFCRRHFLKCPLKHRVDVLKPNRSTAEKAAGGAIAWCAGGGGGGRLSPASMNACLLANVSSKDFLAYVQLRTPSCGRRWRAMAAGMSAHQTQHIFIIKI